jgi:p-hydroxybenzoate 3-monooxygenase
VRAGVLEQATTDLMRATGLGERLDREGLRHDGVYIAFRGRRHRIDMAARTGGRGITIYGQNKVVEDLIGARVRTMRPLFFEAEDVAVSDVTARSPVLRFVHDGQPSELVCDFIAGCDGFHGITRPSIPERDLRVYDHTYAFGWLGILAQAPPSSDELVYSLHERGFALFSMRSPEVTRLYLQCAPHEDLSDWPDDRIWSELRTRLQTDDGWVPNEGPVLQKSVTTMRSFVVEPMRYGRLYLAGDSAHIVPPTGAKGLNLAMADVFRLSAALSNYFASGSSTALDRYSERALGRVWRAQRFSWWMTSMLHRDPAGDSFDYRRQLADLEYLVESAAAMTSLAENYVGTPFGAD